MWGARCWRAFDTATWRKPLGLRRTRVLHMFPYSRSLSSFLACMPNRFRVDRLISAVLAVAWKQPGDRSSAQTATMSTEFFE